jgi:Transposase
VPDAAHVADPFHLLQGNTKLDECRRRVQTTPSAIGAAKPIRSTGPGDC